MSGGILSARTGWKKNIELSSWTWDDYFYLIEALTDPGKPLWILLSRARGTFDRIQGILTVYRRKNV